MLAHIFCHIRSDSSLISECKRIKVRDIDRKLIEAITHDALQLTLSLRQQL